MGTLSFSNAQKKRQSESVTDCRFAFNYSEILYRLHISRSNLLLVPSNPGISTLTENLASFRRCRLSASDRSSFSMFRKMSSSSSSISKFALKKSCAVEIKISQSDRLFAVMEYRGLTPFSVSISRSIVMVVILCRVWFNRL